MAQIGKKQLIESIKDTMDEVMKCTKLTNVKLKKILPKMSIKDLKEMKFEADLDLHHVEEDFKVIQNWGLKLKKKTEKRGKG